MKSNSFQDIFFLSAIIILSSIMIIGLFPGRFDAGVTNENFFLVTAMTVPVIAAIYFIVISFRRRLNIKSHEIRKSLNKKLTISFLFIAVLSTMPIVIVSSTYFNQNIAMMFKGSTGKAIRESIHFTDEIFKEFSNDLKHELQVARYFIIKKRLNNFALLFDEAKNTLGTKGFNVLIFKKGSSRPALKYNHVGDDYGEKIQKFYKNISGKEIEIDRLTIAGKDIFAGAVGIYQNVLVITKEIPIELTARERLFYRASDEYREVERLRDFFVEGSGAFLMILSISIVGIGYLISHFLSKSITRPLEELSVASTRISQGDYGLTLPNKSQDEIGQLIRSFNGMSLELERNRIIMFEKQKLEAWNDMAKKLVHEIKNPLTPIRLSAERMRRSVLRKKENMEESIIEGSETIVGEVDSLLKLVGVFNDFARLPEKKEEIHELHGLVKETISLYSVYDNVNIHFESSDDEIFISLDKVLIKQALSNLLTNAVQAIEARGEIFIGVQKFIDNRVEISIRDTGVGIKSEDVEKVFEPGFTLKHNGTGLGLAIVRKIILEHQGKIICNSILGKGSEFIITLPIKKGES